MSAGQGEAAVTRTELRLLEEMLLAEDSLSERIASLRVSDGVDQQVGERAPQASVVRHQGRPSQRPARRRGEGGPHRTQQKVEAHGEAAAQQQVGRLHVAHVLQLVVRHRVLREALHRELAHEGGRADGHARGDHAVSLSRAAPASLASAQIFSPTPGSGLRGARAGLGVSRARAARVSCAGSAGES